jgi:hypothetical protein
LSSYFSLTQDVNVEGDDGTITQVPLCSTIIGDKGCDTVRYAIYLGMASAIVSITMVFTTMCRFPVLFHVFMACLVLGAWGKYHSITRSDSSFKCFVSLVVTNESLSNYSNWHAK